MDLMQEKYFHKQARKELDARMESLAAKERQLEGERMTIERRVLEKEDDLDEIRRDAKALAVRIFFEAISKFLVWWNHDRDSKEVRDLDVLYWEFTCEEWRDELTEEEKKRHFVVLMQDGKKEYRPDAYRGTLQDLFR